MHPPEIRAAALEMIAQGINDCEVSRRTGIPRATIRDWRRPTYRRSSRLETCPRCWTACRPIRFSPEDYSELLAIYLGDGSISRSPRTYRLRIALDAKYPGIIDDTVALLKRGFPANAVAVVRRGLKGDCVNVSTYSCHLPCLLPQHGPGKKHERSIALEPWQQAIVAQAPWQLIRGLIRTDGCAFVNRTDVHREQPYEYLSYDFSNRSSDIVELFVNACDRVGVFTRANLNRKKRLWQVRINRRESVALMLEHVGLKS